MVDGHAAEDLFASLSTRAPEIVDQVDKVLAGLETVLDEAGDMLSQPESDFRKTLDAMLSSVSELEDLLQSERDRLGRILGNVESVTAGISAAVGEDGAAVSELLTGVSETLDHLNVEIEGLAETNDQLSILLRKLNDGEGTLGLLINDASLYNRLDSTLTGLNNLMADFQNNPAKYLKEMKLVDLF
jgi:phospholipid/cholesterol/gamma-HCH transport system substrate-binding protein